MGNPDYTERQRGTRLFSACPQHSHVLPQLSGASCIDFSSHKKCRRNSKINSNVRMLDWSVHPLEKNVNPFTTQAIHQLQVTGSRLVKADYTGLVGLFWFIKTYREKRLPRIPHRTDTNIFASQTFTKVARVLPIPGPKNLHWQRNF